MKVYACFALLVLALSSAAGTGSPAPAVTSNVITTKAPTVTSDVTTAKAPTVTSPSVVTTTKAPTVTSDVTTTKAPTVTSDVTTAKAPAFTSPSDVTTTKAPTVTSDVTTAKASTVTSPSDVTTTKAPTVTSDVTTTKAPTVTSDVTTTKAPTVTSPSVVTTTKAPTVTSDVITTKAPTVTSDVTTTKAPTVTSPSVVTTTKAPTVTSDVITTKAPTVTSDVITTKAPTVTSDVTTTKAPVATTITPAVSPTTVSPTTSVVISETNLLLGTDELFIELQGDSDSNILNGLTLVIFDGTDGSVLREYNDSTLTLNRRTGLAIQSVTDVQNLMSVAVVLYPQGVNTSEVKHAQDFVSYATGNGTLAKNLTETILLGAPLPVVKSHENLTLSMTRSTGSKTKDNSAFVMAPATRNQTNNPTLSPNASATLQLRGNDCKDFVHDTDVRNMLVGNVNKLCQCGVSTLQIVGNVTCQKDHFFNFTINQSYEGQSEDFVTSFQQYVNSTRKWLLNGKYYSVVNCTQQCWTTGHHLPPPTDSKSGNIKVTVAVVISCIVVFLVILVAVIFYMRSKRRGIMRQFRMTRLQEDDDMDDMENFMGAIDQEPDFSSSRNNLTN